MFITSVESFYNCPINRDINLSSVLIFSATEKKKKDLGYLIRWFVPEEISSVIISLKLSPSFPGKYVHTQISLVKWKFSALNRRVNVFTRDCEEWCIPSSGKLQSIETFSHMKSDPALILRKTFTRDISDGRVFSLSPRREKTSSPLFLPRDLQRIHVQRIRESESWKSVN